MPWIDRARGIGPLFRAVPCPAILVLATSLLVSAQTPPPPPAAVPQFAVVIDAAHGGTDTGAHLTEQLEEKDLVLALSVELRSMLSAHGILVTTTREMDVDLSPLRRAEIANHRGGGGLHFAARNGQRSRSPPLHFIAFARVADKISAVGHSAGRVRAVEPAAFVGDQFSAHAR
jgi:hypothetical protein